MFLLQDSLLVVTFRSLGLEVYQVSLLDTGSFSGILCVNTSKRFITPLDQIDLFIGKNDTLTYFRTNDTYTHRLGMIQWEVIDNQLITIASNIEVLTKPAIG